MAKEHPAMQDFSKPWEAIKHIGGKALKWAAYGAVIVGAVSLIPGAVFGLGGGLLSGFFGTSATGGLLAAMVPALKFGAVAGGIMGAAAGVGGVSGALDDAAADHVAMYEQSRVAEQRASLLRGQSRAAGASSVAPGAGMGLSPSQGLGR